ncbi:hypothetical protein V8E36_006951 [Tilletia maclaganii]
MLALSLVAAALSGSALAAVVPRSSGFANPAEAIIARATEDNNDGDWIKDFPIHESCNASQRLQLQRAFRDLNTVARSAADDILKHGNSSQLFQTYFGAAGDPAVPLGVFERIINGDKTGTLFRCDDPDRNCETQVGYGGHWRGNNASSETVICELSFQTRRPLDAACGLGFQLAQDNVNLYWGTDLLHRSLHIPAISNELITHVADEYADVLELAKNNATYAFRNQHSIQDYAFEVWTRANIDPNGCVGEILPATPDDDHSAPTTTAAPGATSTDASAPAQTGKDCHTHADGTVHCV